MNRCILIGKIIEDVDFKFVYNDIAISIAICTLELTNNSKIQIYALDDKADYMYRELNKNDIILVYGKLVSNSNKLKIKVEELEIQNQNEISLIF